ncbi:HipA family kinase [Evansella tamaricis]
MLNAISHIKKLGRGGSKTFPQLFECEDGQVYVVRPMLGSNNRPLINELVSSKLADLIGLPIPAYQTIYVTKGIIKENKPLNDIGMLPGIHFGCQYIKDAVPPSTKTICSCENANKLFDMFVFDQWINNCDRHKGNVLIVKNGEKQHFLCIDHERAFFDRNWKAADLKKHVFTRKIEWKNSEKFYFHCLKNNNFSKPIDKVSKITEQELVKTVQAVPKEWGTSEEDQRSLIYFLSKRQHNLKQWIRDCCGW